MKSGIPLLALAIVASSLAFAPPASAACDTGAVCVNSDDCRVAAVCVNSEGCDTGAVCVGSDDCYLGAVCVGSERCRLGAVCVNDEDCRLGAVCVGTLKAFTFAAVGTIVGRQGEAPCTSTAALSLHYAAGSWSYSQLLASDAAATGHRSCNDGTIETKRTYTNEDAYLQTGPDAWTITRFVDTQQGVSQEVTHLRFVEGGVLFEQWFATFEGKPSWQASGFLASPQAL